VQLYFKYESAGKCRKQFLSSGDECFENVCTKGHKIVTTATCKETVAHALKEHDPVARIHFCNWYLQSVRDGEVDPHLVFFSSEAWFSLREEANSQNSRYCSPENQRLIHELPFHGEKLGFWCAMTARREISTISGQELQRANNMLRRDCFRSGGQHFQYLL
jgi:hypothetical protein